MDWKTFIISILGSGTITALVNHLMNHRTQIRVIKESGLYSKRADVLDELMKRMEILDRVMRELISPFQYDGTVNAENDRREKASNAFNSFLGFYKENRHYLAKQLSDEIGKLGDEYHKLFIEFSYEARVIGENSNIQLWRSLHQKIQNEFDVKKENLADEFRKIVGVK